MKTEKELTNNSSGFVQKTNPLVNARRHKCHICGKAFTQLTVLRQHYMIHTGEKPFECEICGKCFNKKSTLTKHCLIHVPGISSNVQILKCSECGKEFKTASGLNRHNRKHHLGNMKVHKCDLCDKKYFEKEVLKQHYMVHTGEKPFACENCGKQFNKKSSLVQHFKTHVSGEMLNCSECGKEYKTYGGLAKHQRTTHNLKDEVHQCEICDNVFQDRIKLKRHYLAHTGERPFECDNCGKQYTTKGTLAKHMKSHGTRIVQIDKCPECGKEFKSKSRFWKHKRTLCGKVKDHVCDLCEKKFDDITKLKNHYIVHIEEKPHECEISR